jgi:hypothetical protein
MRFKLIKLKIFQVSHIKNLYQNFLNLTIISHISILYYLEIYPYLKNIPFNK